MECRWQDPVSALPGTVRWAPPDARAHKERPYRYNRRIGRGRTLCLPMSGCYTHDD